MCVCVFELRGVSVCVCVFELRDVSVCVCVCVCARFCDKSGHRFV